jgi:hypothetical protein
VTRQLFRAGLVDSAFWHKFVLTRHSRVYCEWRSVRGVPQRVARRRNTLRLEPIDEPGDFATTTSVSGRGGFRPVHGPARRRPIGMVAGEGLDAPIRRWFPVPVPLRGRSQSCWFVGFRLRAGAGRGLGPAARARGGLCVARGKPVVSDRTSCVFGI